SSSVRAVTDCRLLRVPGAAFRELLERDRALGQRLREIGARQIRNKVTQQMALLRRLGAQGAGWREQSFADGAIVCQQGEPGRQLYVIVAGGVRVFRTEPDGSIVQLARLQAGQSFSELSLIEGQPRAATVVADGELSVLTIDGEDFRRAYEADAQVRSHAAALRSLYSYGGNGIVVQFAAELFDRAALGTLYRLDDGRVVIAHRIIGQEVWSIQQADAPADAVEVIFADPAQGIERTLPISGGAVGGGVVKGAWRGVGGRYGRGLERAPLPRRSAATTGSAALASEYWAMPAAPSRNAIAAECSVENFDCSPVEGSTTPVIANTS